MSRTTNINVNVNSGKSVATITKIKEAFIDLKKAKESIGKDGKIALNIDIQGADKGLLDALSKSINKLGNGMKKLKDNSNAFADTGKVITASVNNVTNNVYKTSKSVDGLGNSFTKTNASMLESALVFETVRRSLTLFMRDYNKLSETTFNVGIASQMNLRQISALNDSFLQLSSTVPSSAQEMASAVDALIRTGRSFEESRQIIEQVAILSTASGDSLKSTSEVVTKVMVSLGVSGDKVTETLTTMHSTAIQTASDMGYLAEAFKNVAGTASVLVKESGLSGKELDDYKQKILDITMASIGSMANLGLGASAAGTKVKNLFGKMVAGEKSARTLFDTAMKINNIQMTDLTGSGKKGELFNYEALSNMTKKDLPKALNILSDMYVKGQLNTQTMQKMFTARHFMEISNLLIGINGSVDDFVNGIAKGISYSNDFYKKMFDINEQAKLLRNNMQNTFGGTGKGLSGALTGGMMILNDTLPNVNKGVGDFVGKLGTVATVSVGVLTSLKAITGVLNLLKPIALTPWGAGIATVASGLALVLERMYLAKKETADVGININKNLLTVKQIEQSLKVESNIRNVINNTLEDYKKSQGESLLYIEEATTMTGLLLGKNQELKDLMESVSKIKPITDEMIPKIDTKELNNLKEEYRTLEETQRGTMNEMFDSLELYISKMEKRVNKKRGRFSGVGTTGSYIKGLRQDYKNALLVREQYEKMINEGLDLQSFKKTLSEKGISDKFLADTLGLNSVKELNEELAKTGETGEKLKSKIQEMSEVSKESFRAITEQITANNKAYNMVISQMNQTRLKIFEKTGEFKGKKGVEGMFELFSDANVEAIKSKNETILKTIEALKERQEDLESKKISKMITDDELKEYEGIGKAIDIERQKLEDLNSFKEKSLELTKSENIEAYKSINTNQQTMSMLFNILQLKTLISTIPESETKQIEALKALIADNETLLKITNKEIESKKRSVNYQLKYNDYVKENLSVELELAKVLQTQGQQNLLAYKYKKEELEINKKLLAQDVQLARTTLSETGYKNNIKTAMQAQNALRGMYEKYGANVKDEKIKKQFESLKILTQSLVKEEKLAIEIALQPLKEFENITNNMPNVIKNMYSSMKGLSEGDLSPINYEYVDYLNSRIDISMQKIKDSWKNILGESLFEGLTTENIDEFINKAKVSVLSAEDSAREAMMKRDSGRPLTDEEVQRIELLSMEKNKLEDLIKLKDEITDKDKEALKLEMARLNVINQMGDVLSKLGTSMNIKGLGDIGGIFKSFGDVTKLFEDPENRVDFSSLFDTSDMKKWTDNFSKMLDSSLKTIDLGSTVGSWIGSITGGGASAQAGGALGGMIAGAGVAKELASAMGMAGSALATGGASLAISAGMSLIGGLFDKGSGDQEEANKRTAEAKKIYDKNTEALNKLAQNMSNLSGGIDGLNNSLISSFSKLPTIGKLGSVEGTLRDMYKTMEATRKFSSVAYQVTKTKKGKSGFLGIGAKAGSTWTETIELSVQNMLDRYGFKGTIEDMTTKQMREFSKWLDTYNLGDSDNFSVLAKAVEDYAEALDKFDKNINKFFYDTTMESFVGISSIQQEELRQQIEDFYKNLGFQIDEAISKEIDKLAEEMSVMVTIMQDVRNNFVSVWKDSGKTAGKAFLSSMTPYVDAMLNNLSQIFYDVYFSDVTKKLEDEFKTLSNKLVELKKKGESLDWSTVTNHLSDSFNKVITSVTLAKQETSSFNDIISSLQQQAINAGLSLSEMLEIGLTTGTQKNVLETFKDALLSSDSESAFVSIGQMVGNKIGDAMADKLLDNMLSDRILQFSSNIDKVINSGMSIDSLAGLATEAMGVGAMLEDQRRRLEAIKSMFDFSGDITYESQESNIKYETGTSTQVVNNYYLSATVEAGNVIESDSIDRLLDTLTDSLIEKLRVDKGIYL